MSKYIVPITSYNVFKLATIGKKYDFDGYPIKQPYQCWDACNLLYTQPEINRTLLTGGDNAKGCWLVESARKRNGAAPFVQVTNYKNIKKGDILVFKPYGYTYGQYGHVAYADEEYSSGTSIKIYGQNFNGVIEMSVQTASHLDVAFLGAFRYTLWSSPSPTPEPEPTPTPTAKKRSGFPWAIAWRHWGY